jgi:FkbM family methyltransferase
MNHVSSAARFEAILAEMSAEAPEACAARWHGLFDRLAGERANKLVLFGAGQLGQWVLKRLGQAGVIPLCFSDNRPELWGTLAHGMVVLSPAEAANRYGETATFIVTIYNGSAARAQMRGLGCRSVLPAPLLFWKYSAQMMPDLGIGSPATLSSETDQIRQCYALLADQASRHELCEQLEWRYWMRPEFLPLPPDHGELYFPADLITSIDEEVVVDGGAYDGDTIRSLMSRGQRFKHMYALEPDSQNLVGMAAFLQTLPEDIQQRVTVWPYALGDKDEKVSFVETHTMGSKISTADEGVSMEARRLDSLPWGPKPTYIKLDIEGYEPLALSGGAHLLADAMPVLAICAYHRTEHLWQIPNLIHSLAPDYSLYLRRYAEDCWEQVCYAVPPGRLRKAPLAPLPVG